MLKWFGITIFSKIKEKIQLGHEAQCGVGVSWNSNREVDTLAEQKHSKCDGPSSVQVHSSVAKGKYLLPSEQEPCVLLLCFTTELRNKYIIRKYLKNKFFDFFT